jgi:hypothetical protein
MRGLATHTTQSEEAVLHVMGLPRWAWASARAPCASRAPGWWPGGRPVVASPGDPASRDESCRVRRSYSRTRTEEDF